MLQDVSAINNQKDQAIKDEKLRQKNELSTEVMDEKKITENKKKLENIRNFYNVKITARKSKFLSSSTAQGLRITLRSTIELGKVLLTKYKFKYVLTSKLNQDCLEVNIFNLQGRFFIK